MDESWKNERMSKWCLLSLLAFSLTLSTLILSNASGNQTDCAGIFTTGILKADSSTLLSTSHSSDLEPYKAIIDTSRAWCADSSDTYQFLQINFGRVRNITSISIQGYKPGYVTYIKKFLLTYTIDDSTWKYYEDNSNNIKVFINSPADDNEVINHPLPSILSAFRIRIKPQEWENWICMRIELFTCDPVDGGFSEWSSWSECENGIQISSRSCDSPLPARGGLNCSGSFSLTRSCITDPCISDPCVNGSQCIWPVVTSSNYTCNCSDGSLAQNCPLPEPLDPCISDPCVNGSQCIWPLVTSSNYTCNCSDGSLAQNCTLPEPLGEGNDTTLERLTYGANLTLQNITDPCSLHPCENATSCSSFINMSRVDYICHCAEGFSGKNCSHSDFEYWEFIPSGEMHEYKNVVVPVAVSVAGSALISGCVGIIYFMAKSKVSKIVPTRIFVT